MLYNIDSTGACFRSSSTGVIAFHLLLLPFGFWVWPYAVTALAVAPAGAQTTTIKLATQAPVLAAVGLSPDAVSHNVTAMSASWPCVAASSEDERREAAAGRALEVPAVEVEAEPVHEHHGDVRGSTTDPPDEPTTEIEGAGVVESVGEGAPEHTVFRAMISPAFGPGAVAKREAEVRGLAISLIEASPG